MGELNPIFDHWRLWMNAAGLSERTIGERLARMRQLLEHADIGPLELQPIHILAFIGRPLARSSKATYHGTIRAYCRWLMDQGLRTDDPTAKTPTPKRPKGTPRPVASDLLEQMLAHITRRRTRTMVLLLALAGLRAHEVAKMRGEYLVDGVIYIPGKGGKTRAIPAHPLILQAALSFPDHDPWFPAYEAQTTAEHITGQAVTLAVSRALQRVGGGGGAHQFRHWFATSLLDAGVNVRVVQELLGHESLATTQIYTRVTDEAKGDAVKRLQLPGRPLLAPVRLGERDVAA
jgi:integrase/recombinase XerD